ncbi:MAG: hypothetical protein OHK0037_34890 [Elainellaceae cyanobacterium]
MANEIGPAWTWSKTWKRNLEKRKKFCSPEKNIGEIDPKLVGNSLHPAWTIAQFCSTVKDCE